MPLPAASPTCGHVLTPGALGQGHWGRRWPTVLGCLVCLALSGIGWGLCLGVWGRSSSWGLGPVSGPCLDGWRLAGSVGRCPWFPGGLCPMLMVALSGGFLCSLLGGCVVVPAVGFLGSVLHSACFRLLWGGLWIVALYTYTLITKHGCHVGPVPWVLHVHAHTHTHSLAQ